MKVDITKQEFRLLLDMLSVAGWIIDSYRDRDDPAIQPYDMLIQKFLSLAEGFGFGDLVEYDRREKKYYFSSVYEDIGTDTAFVNDFVDMSFWEELAVRLARRDLLEEVGGEAALEEMEPDEAARREDELADRYYAEFERSGLDRLRLVRTQ
ncbi:hypothetical protein G3N55_00225 [Dissulfurirhabdus thermomarina]|uniref:Uncharacterized protein n=1 Tax=Dissulfurirhabdus thermomarina TaxID=1765737 RepID=A0A6N9TRS2_DISTH|nr:hypothetical protein [Dissulfurirhabdus thermomarina]NDY41276.1 hypothetical protein [Dissulfurirhabdus thermomarina]NMX23733.1 hypothetical protein [Dissulfurirhabdus thermomarina]